ncbi:MAG: DNA repair protein RadA [Deltaproteobacteria bacterium]|nr:DNA repair protein RadA [Deltaproteobacteria bacterium]
MRPARARFACTACGATLPGWFGQCPRCGAWNSVEEVPATGPARSRPAPMPVPLSSVPLGDGGEVRLCTGIHELDRVLGGGLVTGSLTLLGGDPGVGKSTLLLLAAVRLAERGLPVLYVTGEESARQIRLRADRLGVASEQLFVLAETDLDAVAEAVTRLSPRFLVLDSVQVMRSPEVESIPGSVPQVRAVADRALGIAKGRDVATLLVGHVTREGTLAGPRMLEHLVDTVVYFECDERSPIRVLRAVKNRFGATGELGLFEMTEAGLVEVPDASARLLAERASDAAGTAVVAGMEGSRPLLAEVQALVGRPTPGTPARVVVGVDRARVQVLLAILDRVGLSASDRDVHVCAAGGLKLEEPAADLGLLAALASSLKNRPLPSDLACFGEIGLAGEVRMVSFPGMRLKEARRHGFRRMLAPASAAREAVEGIEVVAVRTVREAVEALEITPRR